MLVHAVVGGGVSYRLVITGLVVGFGFPQLLMGGFGFLHAVSSFLAGVVTGLPHYQGMGSPVTLRL